MNKEIEKSLTTIFIMIAPALMDFGKIGLLNNLRALSPIPLQPQNKPEYGVEVFKSDFSSTLKQLNAVFTYYRENTRSINSASADLHLRDVTNFILGVGILRYQLYSYLYKSGIVNADYAVKDKPGLLKILRSILNEFDVRRKVSDVIYLYYIPKIMPKGVSSPDGIELFPPNGEMIGLYKDITTVSETLPQSRDHFHCPLLFPIHEYVRKRDMRLHEEYLPIIFGNKPVVKMVALSRYMDEFHKLVCSKKFVESVQSAGNHFTEVDISLLDNILAIKRISYLKLIK